MRRKISPAITLVSGIFKNTLFPQTMKNTRLFPLLFLLLFAATAGCSRRSDPTASARQKDPALQTAMDELTRMKSFTDTGLTYAEYSERLLTTKANIDVALQRTNDEAAKTRITLALEDYIRARDEWKDNNDYGVQEFWSKAERDSKKAAEYAFADAATRKEIEEDERQNAQAKAKKRAQQAQVEAAQQAKDDQARVDMEAENERRKDEYERKKAEEEKIENARKAKEMTAQYEAYKREQAAAAEREKARRYAPEGTGFNIKPISAAISDGITTISPGTELTVKQNPDGTLHVQTGDVAADVPAADITNDRDLAEKLRGDDKDKQEAIRQWQAQYSAAVHAAEQTSKPKPTPTPCEYSTPAQGPKGYVSPLTRGPYH